MDGKNESLGRRLHDHRARAGLTQRELAGRAGISVRALRDIEHDHTRRPRARSVRDLAVALGIADDERRRLMRHAGADEAGRHVSVEVLGPLRVSSDELRPELTSPALRRLLGLLALHAGRTVSHHEIVDALWRDRPPRSARNLVSGYVGRLRAALAADDGPGPVLRSGAGYRLTGPAVTVDVTVFDTLLADARREQAAGRAEQARALLDRALRLWRGPVLGGADPDLAGHPAATAAGQRRVEATLLYADLAHAAGADRSALGVLRELTEEHPLHEGVHRRLMLALAGCGEQAAALDLFAGIRARLDEQLGVPPGADLQATHLQVLRQQLTPARRAGNARQARPAAGPPPEPETAGPDRLPRAVPDFVGRRHLLADLEDTAGHAAGPAVRSFDGMPGCGKTAFAVHAAHRLARRYPGGRFFIDLRGHGHPGPLTPAEAAGSLLGQLGVPAARQPGDPEERLALLRSELARRRSLLVLDNAAGSSQVAGLLPTGSPGLVLITSRHRLLGLDGVRPQTMPLLEHDEALRLLARVAGRSRVETAPGAAAQVVRRCGHLPLAIRLVGARLAHRPAWTVQDLARRLDGTRPRLTELTAEGRTVTEAFARSYTALGPEHQRMFRVLGEQAGEWFDDRTAAALAGVPLPRAERLLTELVDRHLVDEPGPGRFRLHDLLREYAAGIAGTDDRMAA